jgi:uncharacterized protein (TIGR03435 family)
LKTGLGQSPEPGVSTFRIDTIGACNAGGLAAGSLQASKEPATRFRSGRAAPALQEQMYALGPFSAGGRPSLLRQRPERRRAGFLALAALLGGVVYAQSNPAPLAFEVDDIKASKSDPGPGLRAQIQPGGRVVMRYATVMQLAISAYKMEADRISGGPAWIDSDRFDIIAKAPPNSSFEDILKMVQTLLAERFKLVIHHEMKSLPAFALEVGKKGPHLQPAVDPTGPKECKGANGRSVFYHVNCLNWTMSYMAEHLPGFAPGYVTLPVVDLTGIKGAYDITFEFTPYSQYNAAIAKGANGDNDPPLVSFFDNLEKLGLKLEKSKQPLDTIVIDSVERLVIQN